MMAVDAPERNLARVQWMEQQLLHCSPHESLPIPITRAAAAWLRERLWQHQAAALPENENVPGFATPEDVIAVIRLATWLEDHKARRYAIEKLAILCVTCDVHELQEIRNRIYGVDPTYEPLSYPPKVRSADGTPSQGVPAPYPDRRVVLQCSYAHLGCEDHRCCAKTQIATVSRDLSTGRLQVGDSGARWAQTTVEGYSAFAAPETEQWRLARD